MAKHMVKCFYCGEVFEARSGLWKDNEVGYRDSDCVAGVGEIPV